MDRREQIHALAKRLVADKPLFEFAFTAMLMDCVDAFTASAPHDTEVREQAYHRHQAISELKATIYNLAQEDDFNG